MSFQAKPDRPFPPNPRKTGTKELDRARLARVTLVAAPASGLPMHRLFVAIRPPQPILDQLLDIMGGVPNARWQDEEQLHLTLRFIGEVDRHQAGDIAAALGALHQNGFEICLSGVGSFNRRGKGTLWAGVTPQGGLKSLHKKIDQACLRVGIAPDLRAYHPHITLARTGRETGPLGPFLERWAGLSSPAFRIDDVRLYESRLGSEGASYTIAARYPLSRDEILASK